MPVFKSVSPAGLADALKRAASKLAQNVTGADIPAFSACAWTNLGTIQLASAADLNADLFAGVSSELIPDGQYGLVQREGKIPGAVASLSAAPGQAVFLAEAAGRLTLSTAGFDPNSTILRVGSAEPADGVAGAATDLLIEFDFISEK